MVAKTIRIDVEVYDRLKAVQRETESFSQVIKRVVSEPLDVAGFLKGIDQRPISVEPVCRTESQIGRWHRSSGRKR
ncbi:MAG: antitoxin VapB family protein [Phycisphaerales bacterium]